MILAFTVPGSLCLLLFETPVRMSKFLLQHPRTSAARRSKLPRVLLGHIPKAYESQPGTNFLQSASHVAVAFRKHKSTHAQSAPSFRAVQHPSPCDAGLITMHDESSQLSEPKLETLSQTQPEVYLFLSKMRPSGKSIWRQLRVCGTERDCGTWGCLSSWLADFLFVVGGDLSMFFLLFHHHSPWEPWQSLCHTVCIFRPQRYKLKHVFFFLTKFSHSIILL